MVSALILSLADDDSPEVLPVPMPRPTRGNGRWWVVSLIGILLGCAVAIWFGIAGTVGRPSWTDLGYRVIDDRNVDVTYVISRPTGRDVTCVIGALDRGFGTVGLAEVHISGSDKEPARRTTRVRTTTRAVTGVVRSCTAS
jgi:hypothetical protein